MASFLLLVALPATAQAGRPAELPKHEESIAAGYSFAGHTEIRVEVTSRRPANPAASGDLDLIHKHVLRALQKTPFILVDGNGRADIRLEFILEPNVRYGMFHAQNAPYVYFTLREAATGQLVYCSFQRAGHFLSPSERLFRDWQHVVQHPETKPSGSLQSCAEQAMRPL